MISSIKIADILSYLLSPVTVAFYVIVAISFYNVPIEINSYLMTITLAIIFLCIVPVISILVYAKKGKIDIWVSDRKTRTPFYIIAIIGYFIGSVIFYYIDNHEFMIFSIAYLCVTIVITLANLKTKLSSHIAGLTGPLTASLFLFGLSSLIFFLLLPLLMWARLKLQAHTFLQLIGGAVIGFFVTFSIFVMFY